MILVDTSVWIDHLHATEPALVDRLGLDEVGTHAAVIEELAFGSIAERSRVIDLLSQLWRFPAVSHDEVMELVHQRTLWGRGLSAVDVHLMASVAIVPGARLWTRDKRLRASCLELGIGVVDA